jgi:hypothetical protein
MVRAVGAGGGCDVGAGGGCAVGAGGECAVGAGGGCAVGAGGGSRRWRGRGVRWRGRGVRRWRGRGVRRWRGRGVRRWRGRGVRRWAEELRGSGCRRVGDPAFAKASAGRQRGVRGVGDLKLVDVWDASVRGYCRLGSTHTARISNSASGQLVRGFLAISALAR